MLVSETFKKYVKNFYVLNNNFATLTQEVLTSAKNIKMYFKIKLKSKMK